LQAIAARHPSTPHVSDHVWFAGRVDRSLAIRQTLLICQIRGSRRYLNRVYLHAGIIPQNTPTCIAGNCPLTAEGNCPHIARMNLIHRLVSASEIWARTNDRSLSRLATVVVNDGKLFERLAGGGSCTIATYERLMAHLSEPANWSGPIPSDAAELLGVEEVAA
jgi:hypothetical protein